MLNALLDRISTYPGLWIGLRRLVEDGFRGEHEVIRRELQPLPADGRRFLDLGCGTGAFAPCFPPDRYTGVDLTRGYVQYAGRTYGLNFAIMDGTALGLGPACFDAALILGVLHHLPDEPARALISELRRVMHAGGTALVIEDIPPPDVWNLAGHAMHWIDRGKFIRSEPDYRALFHACFEVIRSYPIRSGVCDYGVYVLRAC